MDDYERRLADWKAKHGLPAAGSIEISCEDTMSAEEKARAGSGYCVGCGEEFLYSEMRLITRRDDPYIQIDDQEPPHGQPEEYIRVRERVHYCAACWKREIEDDGFQEADQGLAPKRKREGAA